MQIDTAVNSFVFESPPLSRLKLRLAVKKLKQILDQKQFNPAVLREDQFPHQPRELIKSNVLFYFTLDYISCWKNPVEIELMPGCSVR